MIIFLRKTFKYPSLLLYSCTCTFKLTSSLSFTSACSVASKTVNASKCQCAPKSANPQSSPVYYSLPVVADKVKKKVHWCHANKPPTSTPGAMGEQIRRVIVKKLFCWDNSSLIGKAEALHTSKAKLGINSSFSMGRQVFSCPQESRAWLYIMLTWEDKHLHSKHWLFTSSSAIFIGWVWYHMLWNIPWVCRGQLS